MLAAALRIIRADLRARPLNAFLTGLVVAFAVGALVVTLHGRATLDAPSDRLFDATNGAHVLAVADSKPALARLAGLPGVVGSDGPLPMAEVPTRVHGQEDAIGLIGLTRTSARMNAR
jgi:putative ABC transport system permease protein